MNKALFNKYFSSLSSDQIDLLEALGELYIEWNEKVNLVSRKDIEHIYDRHILHALAICKMITFKPQTTVLDLGTGGGLPGLPLAIFFPDCHFQLVDGRNKKIMVVQDIADRLGLRNITATHGRVEELKGKYDFIVSRAVASVTQLLTWTKNLISDNERNAIPNGYILLKGGDIDMELREAKVKDVADIYDIGDYYNDEWYKTKKVIYIPG